MLQLSTHSNARVHGLEETVLNGKSLLPRGKSVVMLLYLLECSSQQREKGAQQESNTIWPICPPSPFLCFSEMMVCFHMSIWMGMLQLWMYRCWAQACWYTNLSLVSKILLEMAAEQKKCILNLVTNCRANRNVYPALNKSREKDLRRRKNFDILSVWYCSWPVLFPAVSFADYATVHHMFYVPVLDYNWSVFLIQQGMDVITWLQGKPKEVKSSNR